MPKKVKVIKKETLSESKARKAFEVVNGFNYPDGKGGEKRVDKGDKKPNVVFEKDFPEAVWKQLLKLEAVKPMVEEEKVREDEVVVFEKIDGNR